MFYHLAYEYGRNYSQYESIFRLIQNIGTNIEVSRPLTRFNRFDLGIDINHIIARTEQCMCLNYNGQNNVL